MKYTDEQVFVEGSIITGRHVKKRFLKLVEHKCGECGIGETWNGKRLVLQMGHINGIHNDNRLKNLRLLCPNCHSQTTTYSGKNTAGCRVSQKKDKPNPKRDKALRDQATWALAKANNEIRFGEWGWQTRVSPYLGVTPQKVPKWIMRVDPKFYGSLV